MAYGNNATLTRRSSERELGGDSKKRATSAGGLDRQSEGKCLLNFLINLRIFRY